MHCVTVRSTNRILKSLPHAIREVMFLSVFYEKGNSSVMTVVEIEIPCNH